MKFRLPFPQYGSFNPVKILPEVLFPLAGMFASFVVMPFTGDFVFSMMIVSSVLLSALITSYVFLFLKLIRVKFDLSEGTSLILAYVLFLFHFMIFRGSKSGTYLFTAFNLTAVYHYLMPSLLNICVVLYMEIDDTVCRWSNRKVVASDGILILACYLAIFSNIFSSIVLAAYISARLLLKFLSRKSFSEVITFGRQYIFSETILGIWLVSLLFELSGGRAAQVGKGFLNLELLQNCKRLKNIIRETNGMFLALVLFLAVATLLIYAYSRIKKQKARAESLFEEGISVFCLMLPTVFVYTFLVCAKTTGGYLSRGEVLLNVAFCFFVLVMMGAAYILTKYPRAAVACPLLAFFLTAVILTSRSSLNQFKESISRKEMPSVCVAITRDLIEQVIKADKGNKNEVVVKVPRYNFKSNWPFPAYTSITSTLYRLGLISKNMKRVIQPDEEMNKKYGIPIPQGK